MSLFLASQIFLRVAVVGSLLAAVLIMTKSHQVTDMGGVKFEAKYTYSPAFKYFVYAEAVVCALSALSLIAACLIGGKGSKPSNYFFLFIHDLLVTCIAVSATAAAITIGFVGKYGYDHVGWTAICDQFEKYCNKTQITIILSVLAMFALLILTITSASKSRQI